MLWAEAATPCASSACRYRSAAAWWAPRASWNRRAAHSAEPWLFRAEAVPSSEPFNRYSATAVMLTSIQSSTWRRSLR